jgi:hypothetical protein
VNLFDNPIFLTQKRLIHRTGVVVGISLAALLGLSLLSGLGAFLAGATTFHFVSGPEAGEMFYGWLLGLEILILPIFGLARVLRAISDDRKSGMWESNRLTPLPSAQLVLGYWFGAPLREYYMGAVLAVIGLIMVVISGLPLTFWLGTQVLVLSATLLFGLLGVLGGVTSQKPDGGNLLIVLLIAIVPLSMYEPRMMLTSFLVPVDGIASLFVQGLPVGTGAGPHGQPAVINWFGPTFFGIEVPPIIFTLGLQLILAVFAWRAVTRKTARPFGPVLLRWEAVALFGVLLLAQHGLVWEIWSGHFPTVIDAYGGNYRGNETEMMPVVQMAAILLSVLLLTLLSPLPERVRLEALRTGWGNLRLVFSRSSLSLALAFTAIAGGLLLTQSISALGDSAGISFIAILNLANFFFIFSLLLEWGRLRFGRASAGFIGLGMFILCILPFILAGVFSMEDIGHCSLLAPGILALDEPGRASLFNLLLIDLAHSGIAVGLFMLWLMQWKRLLGKAAPAPSLMAAGNPAT